jgi:sterol desaturase/sphingolipid hydroxylase (fatty acid hydroxylase superfamily)
MLLVWRAETRRPLRPRRPRPWADRALNLIVAAGAALAGMACEEPLARACLRAVQRRRLGLARLTLPPPLRTALAVLLLDYTLYLWHVLTHRVPGLWRFHRVHHADRHMDVSTAVRFHFAEIALSAPFRALQILAIGPSAQALTLWRRLLLASITFHHANWRLPRRIEAPLSWLLVTPRLHGRHHAVDEATRACNWSSGLALWDLLHGTLVRDLSDRPEVGLDELPASASASLGPLLALPFQRRSA